MLDRLVALALATTVTAGPTPAPVGLPLPPARGPLVFDPGTKEVGLDVLLLRFAELTGQELAYGQMEGQQLQQTREPLESTEPVPPEEVYSFVEGLLARQGVVLAPLTGGTRPILGVYASMGRQGMNPDALLVSPDQLPELDAHPALLVRLLFTFQHTDARQVQTQLRQITVDPSNLTQVVPVGELGLLLQGRAREIAGLVRILKVADEHAGKTSLARPPQAGGEGAK